MTKVLIVDDSGFMRLAIKKMLEKHLDIEIVGEASNADQAVLLAHQCAPDIITMDIEMPGASGIEATKRIMAECPTAIIMVSSLTNFGAEATVEALNHGAVDFIPKASSFVSLDIAKIEKELLRKVYYWSEHFVRSANSSSNKAKSNDAANNISIREDRFSSTKPRLIVIGASTGGPKVLPELFKEVGRINVPIIIALHMPEMYTESFAKNMARSTGHKVVEGKDNMLVEPGMIVVCPGGRDTVVQAMMDRSVKIKVLPAQKQYSIHPSVTALFLSAVSASKRTAGIILTGMGEDGLEGAIEFKKYGLPMIAQNEASSLVYGMPRAVVESGLASSVLDISGIARKITQWGGASSTKMVGARK